MLNDYEIKGRPIPQVPVAWTVLRTYFQRIQTRKLTTIHGHIETENSSDGLRVST